MKDSQAVSSFVRANGVELHVLDTGEDAGVHAPPVLILHGLAGSANEFLPTAMALYPQFRMILMDQRGHGLSTRRPVNLGCEASVRDVVAVIDATCSGTPVRLVGQSMGAHTAMLVSSARPDLVDRLVMLEGHVHGSEDPGEARRLGEFFASWPVPFAHKDAARAFLAERLGDGQLARSLAANLEARSDGLWPRFDADILQGMIEAAHVPLWAEWESLSVPTLAIFAEKGMFESEHKDELIRRRTQTQRADLPGASHDAHLDSFDEWIGVLRGNLE